ncbi:MAG: chemotaxis protein CheW [Cyanobacteria bacterium P01_F01_bin.150]
MPSVLSDGEGHTDVQFLHHINQLLCSLQTIHHDHCNHHYQTQVIIQQLNQAFQHHIQTLHHLWEWGKNQETNDLPSFSEWLDTPVEATLITFPSGDILSGVNPLDTQILIQHGWDVAISPPSQAATIAGTKPNSAREEATSSPKPSFNSQGRNNAVHSYFDADSPTEFQTLLQDLLGHVDHCRTLLTQLNVVQGRSRRTDHIHKQSLEYAEDLLTLKYMRPLDSIYHQLNEYLSQQSQIAKIPINLVIPQQDTPILLDQHKHSVLFQGFLMLLKQWLSIHKQSTSTTTASDVSRVPTISLASYIQGKSLIVEWQETSTQTINGHWQKTSTQTINDHHQSTIMDLTSFQAVLSEIDSKFVLLNSSCKHETNADANADTNQATHFAIQIPLAPIYLKHFVCRVKEQLYGISFQYVEHVILPNPKQLKMATGQSLMLRWHTNGQEKYLRVYSLSQLIQYSQSSDWISQSHGESHNSPSTPAAAAASFPIDSENARSSESSPPSVSPILILQIDKQWIGIMVDDVIDEKMLLIRPLSKAIAFPSWIQGCALVNDCQLALSIDPSMLLQQAVGLGI